MRVFVAGATGVIGRALVPLLVDAGHEVTGTTRRSERVGWLVAAGATAAVVDALDRRGLVKAVARARPDVVLHQLTDLAGVVPGEAFPDAVLEANARLRRDGTRHLVDAARAAGAHRLVAQSIAWIYAGDHQPHREEDPLLPDGPGATATVRGVHALEQAVLRDAGLEGVVLRYGRLYGPGTWTASPAQPPTVSVRAAARAAVVAATSGAPGVYNIVDDGGPVSNARARRELGWAPG